MDVSPFSTAGTPAAFVPGGSTISAIVNRDLVNTTDDLTFRVTFGPPDAAASGRQDVAVRALPAARFPGIGGVLVKGFTGQNIPVRGVGGNGSAAVPRRRAGRPVLLRRGRLQQVPERRRALERHHRRQSRRPAKPSPAGPATGRGRRRDAGGGFDPGETPDYNAPNFFASANTLAIILELPSAVLAGLAAGTALTPEQNAIGFWGRTEANGVQLDRMGRPAINTALIPPVPRGSNFPIGGTGDQNRQDRRNAFNAGHPQDDRANFRADMVSVLTAVYPAGGPANPGQAASVANLLLPDILVYDPTSTAGFFGTSSRSASGNPFLAGGRKLSDDIISTELAVLTDADLPFNGAATPPIVTQNVADDNGLNLTDGSIGGPGNPMAGMARRHVPLHRGANPNPTGVPGGNPPQ